MMIAAIIIASITIILAIIAVIIMICYYVRFQRINPCKIFNYTDFKAYKEAVKNIKKSSE